jgi:RND superfamily putative drug exporter
MFFPLSRLVSRRPWVVVVLWLGVTGFLHYLAPRWEQVTKDDDVRFFPADSLSVIGQELLERGFPQDASGARLVLVYERRNRRVTSEDLTFVQSSASALVQFATSHPELGVKRVDTFRTPVIGQRLIGTGRDGQSQAVLTMVSLQGTYLSKKTRVAVDSILSWLRSRKEEPPTGLAVAVTGSAVVGHDTNVAAVESINNTTTSTIALVILILLVVYRSPLMAMIPLLSIALSVFVSLRLIALLTVIPGLGFQVINITRVFVVVVLFGAGTDYCLFLIARYCEELAHGRQRDEALREAIGQVGGALVASAGTVIVGLGMLYFSSFAKVRYTGPTIAISLSVALLAALTLAPALLALLRGAIFWPRRRPHQPGQLAGEPDSVGGLAVAPFWMRVADLVVHYPLAILVVCILVLAPLAAVGALARPNHNQLADLDEDRQSVVGAHAVARYFAVGELSPALLLVHHKNIDFSSPTGRSTIAELTRRLLELDKVAEVRSLSQPLGKPAAAASEGSLFNRLAGGALSAAALARYVSTGAAQAGDRNHITRLDVVFKLDPFSRAGLVALEQVQRVIQRATGPGEPLEGAASVGIAGSTANISDLKRVTTDDEHRMYVLVTLGVYAILVALLRRPGVCLYLIATVVLGYLASLGLTEIVFSALHRGPSQWGGLDWTVGFFLFVILVAVGEDYNIYLMARVIEEERKHGTSEGTRRAVARTGGIISSCGLIMAGTFGSMLSGSLTSLRELGFALGLGVLLDTFLVRPILVPAFVVLVDRLRRPRAAGAAMRAAPDRGDRDEVFSHVQVS